MDRSTDRQRSVMEHKPVANAPPTPNTPAAEGLASSHAVTMDMLRAAASSPRVRLPSLPIDRRERLSRREFTEEYLRPRRPVVIADAAKDWPALRLWNHDYLGAHH